MLIRDQEVCLLEVILDYLGEPNVVLESGRERQKPRREMCLEVSRVMLG